MKEKRERLIIVILIATAIVLFWRGVWGLMDLYLFPNNQELSLWISLVAGFVILVITRHARRSLM